MKVLVLGAGYVGLATSIAILQNGHEVDLLDNNREKLEQMSKGVMPFFEAGLAERISSSLSANKLRLGITSDSYKCILICVGTPSLPNGQIDLSQILAAVDDAARLADPDGVIVIKSTVLPGTTDGIQESRPDVSLAMVPEFLREGTAVQDALYPDRIIYGVSSESNAEFLSEILNPSKTASEIITNPSTAEMSKYISNSFFATLITFANYWDEIAQSNPKIDSFVALETLQSDRRFDSTNHKLDFFKYLVPGIGFGGSCFPKDLRAMATFEPVSRMQINLFNSILQINEERTTNTSARYHKESNASTYLIAGITFKEGTSDTRESPAIRFYEFLKTKNQETYWYDESIIDVPDNLESNRVHNLGEFLQTTTSVEVFWTNHDVNLRKKLEHLKARFPEHKFTGVRGQVIS
jgi:nucleotide sugar dehydrogenase